MSPLEIIGVTPAGTNPLIRTLGGTHTAADLFARAGGLAGRLARLGASGRQVVLSLDNSDDFFVGLVGIWRAGATPVLLDPLVRRELDSAVSQTNAAAVVRKRSASEGGDGVPARVPTLEPSAEGDALLGEVRPWAADEPLVYLFTSGSTGAPTIIGKNFEQLDVEIRFLSRLLEQPRRVATMVPWCHIYGFLASFLLPLRCGGSLDLSAGISIKALIENIARGKVDVVVAVPAIYRVMNRLLAEERSGRCLPPIRFISAGAPLHAEVAERFSQATGVAITELYGSTEAGGVAYREGVGPWLVQPHVQTRIDANGQLWVRSASVSVGAADEMFPMGDVVESVAGGFYLKGRVDDVVKIGGRRVSLGEIEKVLESHPGVREACVLTSEIRGQIRLVAYLSAFEDGLGEEQLLGFVRARVADHKVPRVIHVLEKLPRNPGGKVDCHSLLILRPS